MRYAAQHQHPGPDEHVDAVLEAAHPARQHDLRKIEDGGAGDAHDERRDGIALCARAPALGTVDLPTRRARSAAWTCGENSAGALAR